MHSSTKQIPAAAVALAASLALAGLTCSQAFVLSPASSSRRVVPCGVSCFTSLLSTTGRKKGLSSLAMSYSQGVVEETMEDFVPDSQTLLEVS